MLTSFSAWAQDAAKVISIKEYNPQQKYDGRVCVVDLYGEMECKEDPKKVTTPAEVPPKNPDSLKPTDPLVPAQNSGWEGAVQISTVGSFNGVGLAVEQRTNHWGFGGLFKFNMYSSSVNDNSSNLELMGLLSANYYLFPRWYAYSNKKTFDLSVNLQAGYHKVSQEGADSNRKSNPIVGMGAKISYPLSEAFRVQAGVDIYQDFSLKSVGSSGFLGVGFNF
jgi:lipopolysaccharide assembly outer membrane protein LptD (OstA)